MQDETVECVTVISFRKLHRQPVYRITYTTEDKNDGLAVAHYHPTDEGLRWALSILRVALKSQVPVTLNIDPTTTPPTINRIRLPVLGDGFTLAKAAVRLTRLQQA
jgi:hypothetical protein